VTLASRGPTDTGRATLRPDAAQNSADTLSTPISPEGRAFGDLLAGQLAQVRAGAEADDRDGAFPTGTFARFRKNGLMGATVPAQLGGLGVSRLYDVAIALLTLAAADASTAVALHVQLSRGLTLSYEWRHGTPRARQIAEPLLRLMAAGEAAVCGAAKDHHSAVTTLSPDGAGNWLLSGRKTLVSMAPIATHFVVHAQTNAMGQPPTLAVPVLSRDSPGLTVLDTWGGLGMRASGTADVVFDRCFVADKDVMVLAPAGGRGNAILAGQTVSSITMLGIYLGIAQAARDVTVGALAGRSAPPQATTRTLLAHIDANLYALRATVGAALMNADILSDRVPDPAERGAQMMLAFQCAKLMVNQLTPAIVNDCCTLIGGSAYSATHPLSRLYRDVMAGGFMQPYNYADGVDFLSAQALGLDQENDYMSVRATKFQEYHGPAETVPGDQGVR
jgi:alkylation response protein AidB-like acyl-CoA dehydrogenase